MQTKSLYLFMWKLIGDNLTRNFVSYLCPVKRWLIYHDLYSSSRETCSIFSISWLTWNTESPPHTELALLHVFDALSGIAGLTGLTQSQEFSFLFLNWKRTVLFGSFVWLRQDCWNREKKKYKEASFLSCASFLTYPAVNVRILKWWDLSCRLLIAVTASRRLGQKIPEWLTEN